MAHVRSRQAAARLAYDVFRWTRVFGAGRIAALGSPRTIIDVGVGTGTPELYKAFPDHDLLLIEPLVEYEPVLQTICAKRSNARYVLAAVGAARETRRIQVVPRLLEHSSFLGRTPLTTIEPAVESRAVEITTLDDVMTELQPAPPFGLKIDTEGFELDVIRGATRLLAQTQFVIAEVSILKRFEESYSFSEFVAEMSCRGFEVFDILNVVRPDPSGTRYADIAFTNTRIG
jgi:FkbM family methyltransferase